jgi:hypothetical protein
MLFSKVGFGEFPSEKLIVRLLRELLQYCESEGPIMARLAPFINQYLDIRPISRETHRLSLYEYLILTSNCDNSHDLTEADQTAIVNNLRNIIRGDTKLINYANEDSS